MTQRRTGTPAPPVAPASSAPSDIVLGIREHLFVVEAAVELEPAIDAYAAHLVRAFEAGGKVLAFGNGGSAADAQHLAAELIGRYGVTRRPLAAVALSTDPSVVTCIGNDFGYEQLFARQVEGLARPEDVVVGFTTSGTSPNVVAGLAAARSAGATTIALTGRDGRDAAAVADLVVAVPSDRTARIQEVHLLITHLVSERIDAWAAS
jgi:D-sedoheptulose 7-phosphate isomerase